MSQEQENDKSYIVSDDGFGGKFFRAANRYIREDPKDPKSTSLIPTTPEQIGGVQVTTKGKSSSKGSLIKVWARPIEKPSFPKVKIAVIQPTDQNDFERRFESTTTNLSPVDYALAKVIQTKVLKLEAQNQPPVERFKYLMIKQSLSPFQNIEEAFTRLEQKLIEGSPFKMACFICLNTKCVSRAGMPVFYLGQDEKRLTTPKLMRRTQQLINLLDETTVPYKIDILIADTDIYDVNGDWLDTPDQSSDIYAYQRKLSSIFSGISPNFDCKLWSEIQAPYDSQYRSDFEDVYRQFIGSDEEQVITNIIKRRKSLLNQGVPRSEKLDEICRITAERNFALYAAQGPIINSEYDCLIMADPEPLRLGEKQSLLAPDLPIWYPYSD